MPSLPPLARCLACCVPAVIALVLAPAAHAEPGDGIGIGPVFVFSATDDDAPLLGWELSLSRKWPFGRAALGGAYPLSSRSSAPGYHYLAWEPWLVLGGTLGGALGNDLQLRGVYGVWAGLAASASNSYWGWGGLWEEEEPQWVISISGGWRGVGSNQQLYFTPKIWRIRGFRIFS